MLRVGNGITGKSLSAMRSRPVARQCRQQFDQRLDGLERMVSPAQLEGRQSGYLPAEAAPAGLAGRVSLARSELPRERGFAQRR
jgi:hypothetical protein